MIPTLAFALCVAARFAAGPLGDDGRPILSGPELVRLSADGIFRIHYTTEGRDALPHTDDVDPQNGVPDVVDWTEEGASTMYRVFVGEDGWPAPHTDEGRGGDDRIDIYLRDLDINGYAHYETLGSGAKAAWMEVAPARVSFGKITYQSIAGHELHHILEFTVSDKMPAWLPEATATYAQYLIFTDDILLDIAREVLWHLRLGQSTKALDATGDRFEYAGMIWIKYLVDKAGGDRKQLLSLWRSFAFYGDWVRGHDAYAMAVLNLASLDEAAADFALWNWFACDRADGRHYNEATLGCVNGNVTAPVTSALPAEGSASPIGHLGSAYVRILPDCTTGALDIAVRPSGRMRLQLVQEVLGHDSPVLVTDLAANANTTVTIEDWNRYHQVIIIATSLDDGSRTLQYRATPRGSMNTPTSLPPPQSLRVVPNAVELEVGQMMPITLEAIYGNCSDGNDAGAQANWNSSDPSVATVQDGQLVAFRSGRADIVATIGAIASTPLAVTVRPLSPSSSTSPSASGCALTRGAGDRHVLIVLVTSGAILGVRRRRS